MRQRRLLISLFLAGLFVPGCASQTPDEGWMQYASIVDAGFDEAQVAAVGQLADEAESGALMVVVHGRVLAAWGDVSRKFELHSVRKSLVSALYGIAVDRGEIELDATLGELGIDEITPLSELERSATVKDLISARSGVYLPAAYAPSNQDENRPERGSHEPGTFWFYNNWDFNVAGVIYEQETGKNLYESFQDRIAEPIGMEDYRPADGFRAVEPHLSRHPAHTLRMSARDLARFGQLYLQEGKWNGATVVPANWVHESTQVVSDFGNHRGYGYMWWIYEPGAFGDRWPHLDAHAAFMGRGTGSQAVFVIPDLDMVVVHRGDTDYTPGVSDRDALTMIDRIVAARVGSPAADARVVPMKSEPLSSQNPEWTWPPFEPISMSEVQRILGRYRTEEGLILTVFEHEGTPYLNFPGRGEAELLLTSDGSYTVRILAGFSGRFQDDVDGKARAVVVRFWGQEMNGRRLDD